MALESNAACTMHPELWVRSQAPQGWGVAGAPTPVSPWAEAGEASPVTAPGPGASSGQWGSKTDLPLWA